MIIHFTIFVFMHFLIVWQINQNFYARFKEVNNNMNIATRLKYMKKSMGGWVKHQNPTSGYAYATVRMQNKIKTYLVSLEYFSFPRVPYNWNLLPTSVSVLFHHKFYYRKWIVLYHWPFPFLSANALLPTHLKHYYYGCTKRILK